MVPFQIREIFRNADPWANGLKLLVVKFPIAAPWPFRGKLFCMQVNDRAGLLFVFIVMLLFGLCSVISPKAVKKENADVPGFPRTGFSWVPVLGWRLFGIFLLTVSGLCLYMFLKH
jgi:formate-dependent nitrite reductase membrane component NrfD